MLKSGNGAGGVVLKSGNGAGGVVLKSGNGAGGVKEWQWCGWC